MCARFRFSFCSNLWIFRCKNRKRKKCSIWGRLIHTYTCIHVTLHSTRSTAIFDVFFFITKLLFCSERLSSNIIIKFECNLRKNKFCVSIFDFFLFKFCTNFFFNVRFSFLFSKSLGSREAAFTYAISSAGAVHGKIWANFVFDIK